MPSRFRSITVSQRGFKIAGSLIILLFIQVVSNSQLHIKKVILNGKGSPVVLLAGGRWDMKSFDAPAMALASAYKVIRMEHFNVQFATEGLTLPTDYSVKTESEAIGLTLDSLGIIEPAILIGWSFGALIALDFALNHPSRVRQLILYEPPAFWVARAKGESPAWMEEMIELTKAFTPDAEITEKQYARFRCILSQCDTVQIMKDPQWSTWIKQKDRLRGLSAVANHTDSLHRLNSFKKPVLILTGEGTVEFHRHINQLLASEFRFAAVKEIPGGHAAPQAAVEEFIIAIKQFIR
jgi:pimeloyl-ACP methyl ester carboxylesterase